MVRLLFIPLVLAALGHAPMAVAQDGAAGSLVIADKLAVQLPEGAPDASERRVLLEGLNRDQLRLVADGGRQSAQIAALGEDLRTAEGETSRLLKVAGALATVLATLLTALALSFVLRRKAEARRGIPGAWYRPAPLPAKSASKQEAALSPVSWTQEEGAATTPFVREFGRAPSPTRPVSG
jgi:hypothetical protein